MLRRALVVCLVVLLAGCARPGAVRDELDPAADDAAPSSAPDAPGAAPTPSATPTSATPAPSSGAPPPSNASANETPSRAPRPYEPTESTAPCDSLEFRSPLTAETTGLVAAWPLLRIDVVLLADEAFVAAHPMDWEALLLDLVADANVHYEEQLGLRLVPVLLDELPPLDPASGADDIRPIGRGHMLAAHPDVAYDYVAIILGADYADTTAGQVDCVGGAYTPDTAYLWSEYDRPRESPDDPFFEDSPLKVFMHESAHLFGAHHHYSDCGEAVAQYDTSDMAGVCDVMINDVGLSSTRFSPTNRLVVRSFVEEHQLGEPITG